MLSANIFFSEVRKNEWQKPMMAEIQLTSRHKSIKQTTWELSTTSLSLKTKLFRAILSFEEGIQLFYHILR